MVRLEERARYRSDGGVVLGGLPVLIGLSLLAALAVAWGLKLAFVVGFYWIILVPALGGAALGGILYGLIGWCRCRNRVLAGMLGLVAGLVGYLGYYHLCLVDFLPPGMEWRVDLLPSFIAFRMETDVQEDVGAPNAGGAQREPSVFMNWFTFVWELGMVVGLATSLPWSRARRVYYPELGKWARREKILLQPGDDEDFRESLADGELVHFVASTRAGSDAQTCGSLVLEYAVPGDGSVLEYPVYASLEAAPRARARQVFGLGRGSRLRQVKLEIAEVLTLRPMYSGLSQLLAAQHEELRGPMTAVPAPVGSPRPASDMAQITPVSEPFRQRVRSRGYALWVNLLGLIPGVYFFGGGALVAGGIYLAAEKLMPVAWLAVPIGLAGVIWGGYTGLYCLCVPENRWINRRLRQEIGQRPDPLVDPQDCDAFLATLIPRQNFAKIQLTMSSDLLLVKIDSEGGQVLMEGDSDRYRIPGGAVAECQPECFYHAIDAQHQNQLWMVRLLVETGEGQRELLLSADHIRWTPMSNDGRRRGVETV
ncbi:MAG: hypothetical protein ACYC6Y_21295, partial [Thermoguttaceae bacterium]